MTTEVKNDTADVVFCRLTKSSPNNYDKGLAVASMALAVTGLATLQPGLTLPFLSDVGVAVLSHVSAAGGGATAVAGLVQVFASSDNPSAGRPLFPGDSIELKDSSKSDVEIIRMIVRESDSRKYIDICHSQGKEIEGSKNVKDIIEKSTDLLKLQLPEKHSYSLLSQKLFRFRNLKVTSSEPKADFEANNIPGGIFEVASGNVKFHDKLDTLIEQRLLGSSLKFEYSADKHMELGFQFGNTPKKYSILRLRDGTPVLKLGNFAVKDDSTDDNSDLGTYNGSDDIALSRIADSKNRPAGKYYWAYWSTGASDGKKKLFGMTENTGLPSSISYSDGAAVYLVSAPPLIYQRLSQS